MRLRFLVLVLFVIIPSLVFAESDSSRQPIIDVHVHVYATDPRWDLKIPNPANGREMTADNEEAHMLATFAEMERHNIVKAVVSNDYDVVLRWKAAAPDRVICSHGFNDPEPPNLDFLRTEHEKGRLMSLGELGLQYEGVSPSDPRMEPWFALAEELDIPVGIHMGLTKPGGIYDAYPKYRASLSDPLLLEEVLIRYPKLRVYVMHAGWPMLDRMMPLMWAHPQVYVDTSVINWAVPREEFHTYLRRLVDAGFGRRIMFGSDQMVWPEAIGLAIESIEAAEFLSEQQKRDIFYNNAAVFFQLEDE